MVACVPGSGDIPLGPTLVTVGVTVVTVGNELIVETGDDGTSVVTVGAGLIVETDDDGTGVALSPPSPISTEPNGIPVGETPLGDEDDIAADDDAAPLVLVLHVPDVAALPGNGVPVPTPNPPPSKFGLEPEAPADGLPMAEHIVPAPVIPIVSVGAGLSPGDASSVAPMDRPTGGTDEPGVMPSGEVVPMPGVGLPIPPTCAKAGLQPKSAAAVATTNARRIVISFILLRDRADPSTPRQPLGVPFSRWYRPPHPGNASSSRRHAGDEFVHSAVEMRDRRHMPSVSSTYAQAAMGAATCSTEREESLVANA